MTDVPGEIDAALGRTTTALCEAFGRELARAASFPADETARFEFDAQSYRLTACLTETDLLPDDWLHDQLGADFFTRAEDFFEHTAQGQGGLESVLSPRLMAWVAAAWKSVDGPALAPGAWAFFHGYGSPRFDLAREVWISAADPG